MPPASVITVSLPSNHFDTRRSLACSSLELLPTLQFSLYSHHLPVCHLRATDVKAWWPQITINGHFLPHRSVAGLDTIAPIKRGMRGTVRTKTIAASDIPKCFYWHHLTDREVIEFIPIPSKEPSLHSH
jgi:hypothetical protein